MAARTYSASHGHAASLGNNSRLLCCTEWRSLLRKTIFTLSHLSQTLFYHVRRVHAELLIWCHCNVVHQGAWNNGHSVATVCCRMKLGAGAGFWSLKDGVRLEHERDAGRVERAEDWSPHSISAELSCIRFVSPYAVSFL